MIQIADKRYTIGAEFCGRPKQLQVLRFCGDFVSGWPTREEAELAAVVHAVKRGQNHTGWRVVSRVDHVLWLAHDNGKKHRVAYGADVKDFHGKDAAAQAAPAFGFAVLHQAGCEGVLDHG